MMTALVVVGKSIKNVMVRILKYFTLASLCLLAYTSHAQVEVKISERIEEQLRIKNALIDTTRVTGYRIQIAFDRNKNVITKISTEFKIKFPEYADRIYILYQQPYWKVRVGDYYREIDAQLMLSEVRKHFPNAFLVKDFIRRPKID